MCFVDFVCLDMCFLIFVVNLFGGNGKVSRALFEPLQTLLTLGFSLFYVCIFSMMGLTCWETLVNGHPIVAVVTVVFGFLPFVPFGIEIERLVNAIPLVLFHMPRRFILSQACVPSFFKALTGERGFVQRAEEQAAQLRAQAVELLAIGEL